MTLIPTNAALAAYEAATGALRWRIPLPQPQRQPTITRYRDLFIAGDAGCLFAINAADGAIRWSHPFHYFHTATVADEFDDQPGVHWRISDDQALLNEDVPDGAGSYVTTITALDLATGRTRWVHALGPGSAHALVADAGHVYIGYFTDAAAPAALDALDAASGAVIWTIRRPDHAPVFPLSAGALVLGLAYDATYAWDARAGFLRWTASAALRALAATDALGHPLIALANPGRLIMLDATDGTLLWQQTFAGGAEELTTLGQDTLLMRTNVQNREIMFDLRTGAILWQEDNLLVTPGSLVTPLDTLFADEASALIALDVRTGLPRWRIPLPQTPEAVYWFCGQDAPSAPGALLLCFAEGQATRYQAAYDLRQRHWLWLVSAPNPPN